MVINDVKNFVSKGEYMALLSIDGFRNIPLSKKCYLRSNGNYKILFLNDGTKLKFGAGDSMDPDMPECLDLTISKWCRGNCPYCYLGCTEDGKNADLSYGSKVYDLLMQLPEYTEVAININDITYYLNKFAGFKMFLQFMEDRKLFLNCTVNQKNLDPLTVQELSGLHYRGLLRGIGVSLSEYDEYFVESLRNEIGSDIVYQVIAGIIDPNAVLNLVKNGANVLILGYKSIGRGVQYYENRSGVLDTRISVLEKSIRDIIDSHENIGGTISFDGLAIEQLHVKDWIDPDIYKRCYAGDEGSYTFYLDLVDMKYAQTSISNDLKDIGDMSIKEMFDSIRVPGLHL